MAEEPPVISLSEVGKYHELGLGRGVNVTNPQMWKNKSSFLVREVRYDNIIGTQQCGLREKYETQVSTFETQQLKIRLSLDDPSSRVKIGMDAQNSRSSSTTKQIAGTKVNTRTISFRVDFNDLPVYTSVNKVTTDFSGNRDADHGFESNLYSWILDRIRDREKKSTKESNRQISVEGLTETTPACRLAEYLAEITQQPDDLKAVANDCRLFIKDLGITHYVSSIELGAIQYYVLSTNTKQTQMGAGAELGVSGLAEGGISGKWEKKFFEMSKRQRDIGRMSKDGEVRRHTSDEAVIGFQIQPIYKLVQLQYIQVALQVATKEYVKLKADKNEGPFLISCTLNKKPIYWTVKETVTGTTVVSVDDILYLTDEHNQLVVLGTEYIEEASLFYILPTGDTFHPSDFFITYWGEEKNDKKLVTNVSDPFVKLRRKEPPLPHYLTTNGNLFGYSSGPLDLKHTVIIQEARFSLHSRVQSSFACMMCWSTPVSLSSWIEGEEFYINCSQRSFKVDGYIAMKRELELDDGELTCTYKTVTVPMMKDPSNSKDLGMLFRLQPPELKERQQQSESNESDSDACSDGLISVQGSFLQKIDDDPGWEEDSLSEIQSTEPAKVESDSDGQRDSPLTDQPAASSSPAPLLIRELTIPSTSQSEHASRLATPSTSQSEQAPGLATPSTSQSEPASGLATPSTEQVPQRKPTPQQTRVVQKSYTKSERKKTSSSKSVLDPDTYAGQYEKIFGYDL